MCRVVERKQGNKYGKTKKKRFDCSSSDVIYDKSKYKVINKKKKKKKKKMEGFVDMRSIVVRFHPIFNLQKSFL